MDLLAWWRDINPDAALLLSVVVLVVLVAWLLLPFAVADLQRKARRIDRNAAELVELNRQILAQLRRSSAPGSGKAERSDRQDPRI